MEPKIGRLVRAVYDFPTDDPNELPLLIGDVVQVRERIDKQWSCGRCNQRLGNFPIGFTIEVKIPHLKEMEELFAATNDFQAQENGDLSFKKGDLIIGIHSVDENWWLGSIDDQQGIFPVTHVWRIDKNLLPASNALKKMSMRARVKMSLKAQIPEEMDLFKDEIVNIIEEVEKGWFKGECNGRQGIFPASFVIVIDESSASNLALPNEQVSNSSSSQSTTEEDNHSGYDCVNIKIEPYGRTLYPFKAEYSNELSFNAGEIVNLIRHVDSNWIEGEIDGKVGLFPSEFVNIVVDCPTDEKEKTSKEQINEDLFPPDTYGRVIFDFHPQLEGDVRLKDGDTVTLIRKVNRNWYEVVTDNGDTGICPENYIEVIGSGPPSYNEVMGQINNWSNNSVINNNAENLININSSLGFNSSFSNQNSCINNFNTDVSTKCIDDKISNGFKGLDSSGLSSGYGSNDSSKSSNVSANSFNENTSSSPKLLNDLNFSFGSHNVGSYENVREDEIRNLPSNHSTTPAITINSENNVNSNNWNLSKAPSRPPLPINSSASRKNSSLYNSNTSLNSTRLSVTSISSHSSTDTIPERLSAEDIKNIIQQKENVLKVRIACKNKLENEKDQGHNTFASNEIKTQVKELVEEIDRLNKEIADLQADLKMVELTPEISAGNDNRNAQEQLLREEEVARKKEIELKRREQEKIKKMKEMRECIITELLQTERDYLSDLKLLQETFLRNPTEAKDKGIDINTLFGNLDEVIDVASRLLKRLQKQSRDTQLIGECFVDMCEEMKEVYGHYCRNHDEVNTVVDKIDPNSSAGVYLRHKLEILKRQTNCFDLPAMLIKPVQRILKYPLLLNELLKCTDDSHPDKQWLVKATTQMTDVAAAVNEFKRRKDLVFKYRKQADTSLSGRVSKLSIHSMAKKTSRFGMRLSSSIGLKTITRDEEFEKQERKFNALEKSLKIFQKDLNEYMKKAEELVCTAFNIAEEIGELYQENKNQKEVDQFRSSHRIILTQHWDSFKQTVERSISSPIKLLLQSFRGPTNLIQKRYDKLLDYESSSSKLEKNKDVTKIRALQENQTMAKHTYEALNSQLLDDLPKLHTLSIEILYDCIRCFLKAKKNFIGRSALQIFSLMELPLLLSSQGSCILDTFQVKHTLVVDKLSQLSISPKEFDSCLKSDTMKRNSSPRGSKLSFSGASTKAQNSSQRVKVKSCYPHTDLYTACENFDAVDIMDISLRKGDIVGVIKQQDPMGQKLRWFVDNGDAKGFIPAKCLIKFLPTSTGSWDTDDWNSSKVSPAVQRNLKSQDIYATSKKQQPIKQQNEGTNKNTRQHSQSGTLQRQQSQDSTFQRQQSHNSSLPRQQSLQPMRPAPPVAASLRVVPPSRYPTTAAHKTSTAPPYTNDNMPPDEFEPVHRYEEIDEYEANSPQPQTGGTRKSSEFSTTTSVSRTSCNVLDEFDPYSVAKSGPELYDNVPDNVDNLYSEHRYEDIPDEGNYDQVPDEDQPQSAEEYYFAMYDFSPSGPNQLPLRKGQVILVVHKCDLNRNTEWWFVEDRHGKKGYVPSTYLSKYPSAV